MDLTPQDRARLTQAVISWGEKHPAKNQAVFQILGIEGEVSPAQLAQAVRDRSDLGRFFLEVVEHAASVHSVDFIASSLEQMFAKRAIAVPRRGQAAV